jgi:RNA polymerase sigma factor (TIGR02999 family)
MGDFTVMIEAMQAGDPDAAAQLLPLVYDELRRLAAHRLAHEPPGQTLQPTALVHEVYLRLLGDKTATHWQGRAHFFGAAAQAMRRILVETARSKRRRKRGSGMVRHPLDEAELLAPAPSEDLLALDEALTQLAQTDRAAVELVQLRYFGGLAMADAAQILGISTRTAERLWTYARAWLHRHLNDAAEKA